MMTVNEFWARLAINAVVLLVGLFLVVFGLEFGALILLLGLAGIIWTAIAAKRQTVKMNRAIQEKRMRDVP